MSYLKKCSQIFCPFLSGLFVFVYSTFKGFPGGSDILPAMQETQLQSLGWEDILEKGKATHSSILAWRIPWTEEPVGLQSMGSEKELNTTEQLSIHIALLKFSRCFSVWFQHSDMDIIIITQTKRMETQRCQLTCEGHLLSSSKAKIWTQQRHIPCELWGRKTVFLASHLVWTGQTTVSKFH